MRPFRICVIHPPGSFHGEAFREIAEALHYSLLRLGMAPVVEANVLDDAVTTIVLGAHLERGLADRLPRDAIVYNLEQLTPQLFAKAPDYRAVLERARVWDFARENASRYAEHGLPPPLATLAPGPVPEWSRIVPAEPQDIDVLFCGSLDPGRIEVLRAMAERGIAVKVAFGTYGPLRDALIARAKLVLNLSRRDRPVIDIVRVGYLLANRVAVVIEDLPERVLGEDLATVLARAESGHLPALCAELLAGHERRAALAEAGRRAFERRDFATDLAIALGLNRPQDTRTYPTRIDLRSAASGSAGLRLGPIEHADAPFEPGVASHWPVRLDTARFGRVPLCASMIETIDIDAAWLSRHPQSGAVDRLLELMKPGGALCVYGSAVDDESRFGAASSAGYRLERAQNVNTTPRVWWKVPLAAKPGESPP